MLTPHLNDLLEFIVAESLVPLLQHSLPWTPVVRNIKNRRVKITVENGTYVECAMFSYFLGQKHSQMCKISPMILFLNKESIV